MSVLDSGSEAWLLTSTALVLAMLPALAAFYAGMVSPGAVLHTMGLSFVSMSVCAVLWSTVGYSLAFGPPGATNILGNLSFGLFDAPDRLREGTVVSEHAYFLFQLSFNTVTVAVISGAVVERVSLWAWALFSALWTVLVYCPLARWIFYPQGFLAAWGVLDFAGGLVVETSSGVSAFVLAYWVGGASASVASASAGTGSEGASSSPSSATTFTLLGAGCLWIGWLGFNGGSAVSAGYLAARALANTHLAASAAMAAWALCEVAWGGRAWLAGRPTAVGAASGAVAGLVAITPACGYVSQMAALLIGAGCAAASFWATRLLKRSGVDDRLECLPVHGVAGALGILLTGLCASEAEGAPANGAFYGGGGALLLKQAAALCVTVALCSINTTLCYWLLQGVARLTGWSVRVPVECEGGELDAWHRNEEGASSASPASGPRGVSLNAATGGVGSNGGGDRNVTAPLLLD